ncbi:MAG: efflux transporter periplasmic adaptor subunit [Bacteroidetes bacterium RIFOXYA12_FULL_35_11]|nr:MAG: efflux transporter periplasmic adaptor subunit [Bacteroidetes bacterium GWF2_35_48]OFY76524.1 MAG: efflux transporter periplasmic adaptor subunit [Bacteroidetes bacterium RIFOXYA12_FULL_35_11]OFZ01192.1 MAG: efflux transporter periplasmic adaptor subunit [Bacteroidetes bacterium RIFOXYC12_FULL_35_7]HBX51785.1 efflux RND transporter periplasmic adaptor subunit [Bacteroidales bacterium]
MKKVKMIIALIVVLALIVIVIVRLKSNKTVTQNRVFQYNKEQAINVQVDTLKLETVGNINFYTGTFEPNKETKLSAEIQGKINTILVDVGSNVGRGQALVQLDNSLLKLQLKSIEIQIEGLEADVKRYTVLSKAEAIQGVQLEKAELGLKSAKVQKETLIEQINKTTITAPFNGIVTAKLTEEGAFAAPGVPLLQITDISILKFTVNIPEHELNQFMLNQIYSLTTAIYPDITLSGKVTMTGSKANMSNSFPIQFSVNNTVDLKIKSGMFGQVNLKNNIEGKQIAINTSAIVGTTIQPQVYIVRNGKSVLQSITVSNRVQNKAIISSGLKEGDVIVTNGFINLFDGANVNIN